MENGGINFERGSELRVRRRRRGGRWRGRDGSKVCGEGRGNVAGEEGRRYHNRSFDLALSNNVVLLVVLFARGGRGREGGRTNDLVPAINSSNNRGTERA